VDDDDELWAQFDLANNNPLPLVTSPAKPAPLRQIGNTIAQKTSQEVQIVSAPPAKTNAEIDFAKSPYFAEVMRNLRKIFGLDSFRPNQLEAVLAALSGRDVFVLMPTGGGKVWSYFMFSHIVLLAAVESVLSATCCL